jgi:TRAP-type mannitol/chloroaromatic compound transport system permease large subunit
MRALRRERANMSRSSNLAHACGGLVNARTTTQPEVCTVSHLLWGNLMRRVIEMGVAAPPAALERATASPGDEIVIMSLTLASLTGLALAIINRGSKLGLLSKLAEQVTFVLMPPLILIFLVLGTIFLGVATPTEGGAMGALGALILAMGKRRMSMPLLKQALENTAKLASFVLFILIGSTVFSFTFNAADGHIWVEHLFTAVGADDAVTFLIVVNIMIFVLAFFLDFFEIAFIVVPLLVPMANKLGIDLIWFGVLICVNMQTSFMHPPFGFALFYLRGIAPPSIKSSDIYIGAIPWVLLQLLLVAVLIFFPEIVTGMLDKGPTGDVNAVEIQVEEMPPVPSADTPTPGASGEAGAATAQPPAPDPADYFKSK